MPARPFVLLAHTVYNNYDVLYVAVLVHATKRVALNLSTGAPL